MLVKKLVLVRTKPRIVFRLGPRPRVGEVERVVKPHKDHVAVRRVSTDGGSPPSAFEFSAEMSFAASATSSSCDPTVVG